MKEVREELHSFRHARSRPREVRISVDGVHRRIGDVRQAIGNGDRLLQTVAAGRDDDDLRIRCRHVVPGDASGIGGELTERIVSAGGRDHLRHPMSGAEKRLRPLEERDWSPRRIHDCLAHPRQSSPIVVDELLRGSFSARGVADCENVLLDLGEVARRER